MPPLHLGADDHVGVIAGETVFSLFFFLGQIPVVCRNLRFEGWAMIDDTLLLEGSTALMTGRVKIGKLTRPV